MNVRRSQDGTGIVVEKDFDRGKYRKQVYLTDAQVLELIERLRKELAQAIASYDAQQSRISANCARLFADDRNRETKAEVMRRCQEVGDERPILELILGRRNA